MERIEFTIKGQSALLMHNGQLANPLNKYVKMLKPLTGNHAKTDADFAEISRIEWEGGLYLENGKVVIPAKCLNATFFAGARKRKNGPKWKTGAIFDKEYYNLEYPNPKINVTMNGDIPNPELDKFYELYSDQDMVVIGRNKVLRTRPIFPVWSCEVAILYDEGILDERVIKQIAVDAGYLVGIMDRRPSSLKGGTFGRFEPEF